MDETKDPNTRVDLGPDELLSTTRSVRRRLDLTRQVDPTLIEECLALAQQAPSGGNQQGWSFVIVTDRDKRRILGALYKKGWDAYLQTIQAGVATEVPAATPSRDILRAYRSAQYLADHMGDVPALVIPCIAGRTDGASAAVQASQWGSILPAVWSFMLAARARDWAPAGQHCTCLMNARPQSCSGSRMRKSCRRQ